MTYEKYHAAVLEQCCKLFGEGQREFFDKQCEYLEEFRDGLEPSEVAQAQLDACDGSERL